MTEVVHCAACGGRLDDGIDHDTCARPLDPPRWCGRCGRRLDVQVYPTGVVATCRTCDGVHPARRGTPPPV